MLFLVQKFSDFRLKIEFKSRNMKIISRLMAFLLLPLVQYPLLASDGQDFMRSIGKIWVVVGVILAIFLILVLFLVYLDRRLTKLENQTKNNG